jgi:hypothetical protein
LNEFVCSVSSGWFLYSWWFQDGTRKRKYASRKCCVPSCSNSDLDKHLHTFPQLREDGSNFQRFCFIAYIPTWLDCLAMDCSVTCLNSDYRCLTWVEKCGNKSLLTIAPAKLNGHYYVCEEHFDDDQYVCPTKKQRVKKSAVPSLKCPSPMSTSDLSKYVSAFVPQFMVGITHLFMSFWSLILGWVVNVHGIEICS